MSKTKAKAKGKVGKVAICPKGRKPKGKVCDKTQSKWVEKVVDKVVDIAPESSNNDDNDDNDDDVDNEEEEEEEEEVSWRFLRYEIDDVHCQHNNYYTTITLTNTNTPRFSLARRRNLPLQEPSTTSTPPA